MEEASDWDDGPVAAAGVACALDAFDVGLAAGQPVDVVAAVVGDVESSEVMPLPAELVVVEMA